MTRAPGLAPTCVACAAARFISATCPRCLYRDTTRLHGIKIPTIETLFELIAGLHLKPEGEPARTGGCNTAAGVHSTTPLTVAVPPNSPASHPSLTPSPPSLPLLGELLHNVTLQNRTIEFDGGCRLWLGLGHL